MKVFGSFLLLYFLLFKFVYSIFFFLLGAPVNVTDEFGQSPLHYAAIKGNCKVADILLQKGEFMFLHF